MRFFNPVHRMPLVEIVRGEQTSDETINRVVAYAAAAWESPGGRSTTAPNVRQPRCCSPTSSASTRLVADGADFAAVDKVMERVPAGRMGPAHLLDVVGIDTTQPPRR